MTAETKTFNVHLYREMRLYYPGIRAATHEAAAAIAADKRSVEADDIEDCEGENLAALVDLDGDLDYLHSKTIDLPTARRQAADTMLDAGTQLIQDWQDLGKIRPESIAALQQAIAKARVLK